MKQHPTLEIGGMVISPTTDDCGVMITYFDDDKGEGVTVGLTVTSV